jgi:hypothetical protein
LTTSSLLTDYTDALRAEPERWLGLVVLYSVADLTASHADLDTLMSSNGLGDFVPRRPGDADVFRRTCSAAQRKRQPIPGEKDTYANVLIRDVANDAEELIKRMVIETVDGNDRRLDYSPAYDLVFDKTTSTADVRRIGIGPVDTIADEVAMEILREYERLKGTVDSACIRTVIGRILDACHATSLRPGGGSYFVARQDAETVAALERFAASIPAKDDESPMPVMVHSIPLPNDPKQRGQLTERVEEEAKVEIERVINEIAAVLRTGEKVSAPAVATFAGKYKHLVAKAERYADLLDTSLTSVKGALMMLDLQMAQLTGVRKVS